MTVDIICLSSSVCLLSRSHHHHPLLWLPPASSAFTVSMIGRTSTHPLLRPHRSGRPCSPPSLPPTPFLRLGCHQYLCRHVDGQGPR